MKLLEFANTHVTFKHSLGMRFATQPRVLKRFCRVLGDIDALDVTPQAVRASLDGDWAITNTWVLNYRLIHGLFSFEISSRVVKRSPLPDLTPSPLPAFMPHIYSTSERSALLSATSILKSSRNPLQPFTIRALILTLHSKRMRVGETLRLSLRDADLNGRVFTVRDIKFFKSRLVPLGSRLTDELITSRKRLCTLPTSHLEDSPFFASSSGEASPCQHVTTLSSVYAALWASGAMKDPAISPGCTIFVTTPPFTGSSHGIGTVPAYSICCRSWPPTSGIRICAALSTI